MADDQIYGFLPEDLTLIARVRLSIVLYERVRLRWCVRVRPHCAVVLMKFILGYIELPGSGEANGDCRGKPGLETAQEEERRLHFHQKESSGQDTHTRTRTRTRPRMHMHPRTHHRTLT